MTTADEWGHEPSVMAMRGLFTRMESCQKALLEHLGISPYDVRLRPVREEARRLFERMLHHSAGVGGGSRGDPVALYIRCLIQAMKQQGLPVPAEDVLEE